MPDGKQRLWGLPNREQVGPAIDYPGLEEALRLGHSVVCLGTVNKYSCVEYKRVSLGLNSAQLVRESLAIADAAALRFFKPDERGKIAPDYPSGRSGLDEITESGMALKWRRNRTTGKIELRILQERGRNAGEQVLIELIMARSLQGTLEQAELFGQQLAADRAAAEVAIERAAIELAEAEEAAAREIPGEAPAWTIKKVE